MATAPNERQERCPLWHHRSPVRLSMNEKPCASLDPVQGIEPRLKRSERSVLPLDETGINHHFVRPEGIEPSLTA